ncbi:MAG: ATP-binding protein, partial [Deltaproteobacteria bacterium]|nr:ATP-binding protein [Deltaproteobacteria bacterium]
ELGRIRESVADATGIHIALEVVPTGEGKVLVARLPPRPRGVPFHTNAGKYLVRLGDQLRGMTVEEIDAVRAEAGREFTATPVASPARELLSATGMEELRRLMREASASDDLVRLADLDLLRALGVLTPDDRLTVAGLLLAGTAEAIRQHVPDAQWQFRRMVSDTAYEQAEDGADCLPVALRRLRELVGAHNPIVTIPGWLVQPEFPRYPSLTLRELLVNALVHRDYAVPGPVSVKLYPDRLEISNAGGFVGGVTPENILHHPSAPRYPTLFQALTRMRLANAANLGVPRVFRDLLSEGKEPPTYWSSGRAVRVSVKGQETSREFVELVHRNPGLDVDHLLIVHYLTRHREITARTAADLCQRPLEDVREVLGQLTSRWRLLEAGGGSGRGRYYRLSRGAYELLEGALRYHVDRRLSLENAKARVLQVLADRPLTNAEIREITQLERLQVVRLMRALEREGRAHMEGRGRGSRWRGGPSRQAR